MRRLLSIALPVLVIALAGCGRKPKDGTCNSDKDCAAQEGFGKICVQGRCQECSRDTDCPAGFACRDNKCAPRAECDETRPCGAGQTCEAGRCVAAASAVDAEAARRAAEEEERRRREAELARCAGELQPVSFDFDAATLRPEARDTLARAADCLKGMKGKRVSVEGHADERGTNEYNLHLSQRRAESVLRYLVNLGVDGGTLSPVSYGEEQPVCTESTEDCWRQNRRVELKAQ
jgi:peptidoglycan-associated lipoprotein